MDARKAILLFQHAERIKSQLIIASRLLSDLAGFSADEYVGAEKLLVTYLQAVIGEVTIAQGVEKSVNFIGTQRKIEEAIGRMKLAMHEEAIRCISDALSLITTMSQASMEALIEMELI